MRHSMLVCSFLLGLAGACSESGDSPLDGGANPDMTMAMNPPVLTGSYACTRAFAGTNNSTTASAAIDGSGDVAVLGGLSGSGDLGGGTVTPTTTIQPFVAKYGPNCEYRWAQLIDGGPSGQVTVTQFHPIAVDSTGNVLTVVNFSGTVRLGSTMLTSSNGGAGTDLLLLAYGSAGNLLSARRLGGPAGNLMVRLMIAPDGNLIVAGGVGGASDLGTGTLSGPGKADLFIAKYTPTGSALWAHIYGSTADDLSVFLAVGPDGSAFLLGNLGSGTADLGGGSFTTGSQGAWFLAKYGADGSYQWSRHAPPLTGYLGLTAVAATPDGGVVIAGDGSGSDDLGGGAQTTSHAVVMARYSSSGAYVSEKRFSITPASGAISARGLAIDASGNLSICGEAQAAVIDFGGGPLTQSGTADGYVVKLRPDWSHVWGQRLFAMPGYVYGWSVGTGRDGQVAFVGNFNDKLDVMGHPLVGTPNRAAGFLARFLP